MAEKLNTRGGKALGDRLFRDGLTAEQSHDRGQDLKGASGAKGQDTQSPQEHGGRDLAGCSLLKARLLRQGFAGASGQVMKEPFGQVQQGDGGDLGRFFCIFTSSLIR
jgi:hypothetical protein